MTANLSAVARLYRSAAASARRALGYARRQRDAARWLQRFEEMGLVDALSGDIEGAAPFLRRWPPGHYYSPVPDQREIARSSDRLFGPVPEALPGIDLRRDAQIRLFVTLARSLQREPLPTEVPPDWRFQSPNPSFDGGDALVLHALLRHLRPKRLIEIGSGYSSALMLDTDERWLGSSTLFTFVEPYAETLDSVLRPEDRARVEVISEQVQDVPVKTFARLDAGDVLFIDSTHVVKPGSDVVHLFTRVLPLLASGVVVHIHDIFWPFEYPRAWIDEGRAWTESYLLHAFLCCNPDFEIMLFNDWLQQCCREELLEHLPDMDGRAGGSIWLRRR